MASGTILLVPDQGVNVLGPVELLRRLVNAMVLANCGNDFASVAAAVNATQINSTVASPFKVNGVWAAANFSAATPKWTTAMFGSAQAAGFNVIPNGFFSRFLLCGNISGTASVIQGISAPTAAGAIIDARPVGVGTGQGTAVLPVNLCVFVTLLVQNAQAGGATFTPGGTSFAAAGVTTTISNGLDYAVMGQLNDGRVGSSSLASPVFMGTQGPALPLP